MPEGVVARFAAERERLNEIVMKYAGTSIKRFYALDERVYEDGALPRKTKELLGLVASLVLRCDDCIKFHTVGCHENAVSDEELEEALAVALVVGGSIAIPHLRRCLETWDELKAGA
jgi:AhpD family alkylhydroperoxidase